MDLTNMNAVGAGLRQIWSILLAATVMLAGCAGSGDVERVRQERAQAKAKMSAELQQERALAASMEKDSEAQKAEADKLAKALGGKQGMVGSRAKAQSMSLTTALATAGCQQAIAANPPNPAVPAALYINGTTLCSNVTVGATDVTPFTAQAPLIPVVIGSGGTLALQDQTMTLYASSFLIQNGGTMQAGTATTPIQNQITIVMAGNSSASLAPQALGNSPIVTTSNNTPNARDITVMNGGVLQLYGSKGLSAIPDGTHNNPVSKPAFINTVYGTKSWTYLAVPAGPSRYNDAENVSAPVPATNPDTTLTLATTVDWQANDWVSVATTSFSSHQTETVQICAIASVSNPDPQASALGLPANVSQITLCSSTPLKHYHYGGLAPTPGFFPAGTKQAVVKGGKPIDVSHQAKSFYDHHSRNYGIDERAEVALLSRNIKLTSIAGQSTDNNTFIGGHLVAMYNGANPTLTLVGVEIEKFGQGLVGRYPVHLHMLNNGSGVLVQDVSVHHSYNKCYVPHQTPNAKFYNNVCLRTVGQGMYLEDGTNITGNQFMRNHIAGVMSAVSTYTYPQQSSSLYWDGDNLQGYYYSTTGQPWYQISNWYNANNIPDTAQSNANANLLDSTHPGGFWITNLGNTFVNNSVAGCQSLGRGYWLLAQGTTSTNYPEFTGNRVHACYNGIDNDDETGNTVQPYPMLPSATYAPVLLLSDNTITRSRNKAAWFRNWYATLHNHRFATNLRGFSLLVGGGPEGTFPGFWGLVYQNVIAGMTRNNVERYPACQNLNQNWMQECTDVTLASGLGGWGNYPSANTNVQGYSYYDGPARIERNRFVNFRFDPTGISTDQAARLLTKTDIANVATYGTQGQLEGIVTQATANAAPSSKYEGYVGDVANGWQTSNAQTVPPTQYIRDSIWDNVDFKHQVYTEAVNMGPFNDGDKTTVIRDLDSQLSGLRVVDGTGTSNPDVVPISLNSVDYYATDFTVDEPHSRGPNDFRSTSLMSPHKYATLNIESVTSPFNGVIPTPFRALTQRDMPAYGDSVYPNLFLNGRGQYPIYEPFVMDRMGYTVYGVQGTENNPPYTPTALQDRLLFSYTDPAAKKTGEFFVNRIAVYQPVATPANIAVYRIRRQWGGQAYGPASYPLNFNPPGGAGNTCDGVFNQNQPTAGTKWQDCLNRANNKSPYTGGMTLPAATSWSQFEQPFKTLMGKSHPAPSDIAAFVAAQTYYYDTTNNLLYFYMIEDQPVQNQYSPFGTCDAANYNTGTNYLSQIQGIKTFSDPNSVKAALNASCLVSGGTWTWGSSSSSYPITKVTNAAASGINAVVVTSLNSPPTGTQVTIAGVQGLAGVNTTWTVTNIDATHFSLNNSSTVTTGTFTGAVPQPNDLFVCNGIGCAAYLVDFSTAGQAITGVSYTGSSPFVVSTSATLPSNGTLVSIAGVQGTTGANGTWTVTSANTPPGTFTLKGSTGSGTYVSSTGSWNSYPPPPAPQAITNVSATSPICITSSTIPPAGTSVAVSGVQGITGANGTWVVPSTSNCSAGTFALQGSTGSGTYTANSDAWNIVPHPLSRSNYSSWNQYHFVYGTPAQQPNGLPVAANPAIGNTTPPQDATALPAFKAPVDGTAPPTGNNITYDFLPLSGGPNGGGPFPVTENFRYHCVTTPPWAPVNARGAYPPSGGFTYPLHDSVCTMQSKPPK